MRFSRLDAAIALAKKESPRLVAIDPRLQSFVVGYLVVDIVSEFEQRIEEMFVLRAKKLGDVPNANFVAKTLHRRIRSPDVGKIKGMLKNHDDTFVTAFEQRLVGSRWQQGIENLLLARHYYVHKSGATSMTIPDVADAYNEAVKLFDALAHALGLSAQDCAHLT